MRCTAATALVFIVAGCASHPDGAALTSEVTALAAPARAAGVPDPGTKGPHEVGFTSFMLVDPSRPGYPPEYPDGRPIPVYVWYPADRAAVDGVELARYPLDMLYGKVPEAISTDLEKYGTDRAYQGPRVSSGGPFPTLVFSPGLGVPAWMHASLGARLASHGFVVAVPFHIGDWWWPWEPYDAVEICAYNRPRDMSFVLDRLLERNTSPGLLNGALRPPQVAAGGWSIGGYAAITLAAGDDDVCVTSNDTLHEYGQSCTLPAGTSSSPDPRFKALLSLDGSGQLLHFAELARVTIPSLGLGEEWSYLATWNPSMTSWHARTHAALNGHPNYRIDVAGTEHSSFSDFCDAIVMLRDLGAYTTEDVEMWQSWFCTAAATTPNAEVRRLVSKYSVAFLKTQLAGESGYQDILTPGYALAREPGVEFFVTEKRNAKAIDDEWPGEFVYFPHQPGGAQAHAAKDPAVAWPSPRLHPHP